MAKKERTSFTSMLGGDELVSPKTQKTEEVEEEMTRLILKIVILILANLYSICYLRFRAYDTISITTTLCCQMTYKMLSSAKHSRLFALINKYSIFKVNRWVLQSIIWKKARAVQAESVVISIA